MAVASGASGSSTIDTKDGAMLALMGAFVLALFASLAVLFVGEVVGQQPCRLCWYQRAAMFPLVPVLGVAAWRGDLGVWRYALPVAVAGLAVALFHTLLYYGLFPEEIEPCGAGPSCTDSQMEVLGLAIPVLSLASFAVLCSLMLRVRQGARNG